MCQPCDLSTQRSDQLGEFDVNRGLSTCLVIAKFRKFVV